MKVRQYPHHLFAVDSGESVQDENGNWVDAPGGYVYVGACREESDGRGTLVAAGGTFHRFSSLIQLPRGSAKVETGTSVMVSDNSDGSGERIRGEVLKFDVGQLHSRLWV